jgi:hypothetical protein
MKKIHVMLMAFQRVIPLRLVIDCFVLQTDHNWIMSIVHDGPAPEDVLKIIAGYDYIPFAFYETPQVNGSWGFPNRNMMLKKACPEDAEWILFCADDSYYVPRFVEYMLEEAKDDVGIVYCDMVHSHLGHSLLPAELKVNHIDMGAFIVRTTLAKEVGFNHISFAADGLFAEECAKRCDELNLRTVHIPKPLFCHN